MAGLTDLYGINDVNLAARRAFVELGARDIATLAKLVPWASRNAAGIAVAFYDHQFAEPGTRIFFERFAKARGLPLPKLRQVLEQTQAEYLRQIFAEAASGSGDRFGTAYYERRLAVGAAHNKIDLPLKWYVGSYVTYFDLTRARLRHDFPHRPALRARAERALVAVFNLDMQAVVESFYYDTFSTMGLDLSTIEVPERDCDLSDHAQELKLRVRNVIGAACRTAAALRVSAHEIACTTEETGRTVSEVAHAIESVAQGAEDQSQMVDRLSRAAAEVASAASDGAAAAEYTAQAAGEAREAARQGAATAAQASEAMIAVRDNAAGIGAAIRTLAGKSEQIGEIVVTIAGIAEQTNLLALNAAIEAARAGEEGRGFAVVADEVRRLAESSHAASNQIAALIAEIQGETHRAVGIAEAGTKVTADGVETVSRASDAFQQIGGTVEDMTGRVEHIVAVTQQITAGSATLRQGMNDVASASEQASAVSQQVSASTQQTSAATQQTAATAAELARIADDLGETVALFSLID